MAIKSKYKVESNIPIPKKHKHWSRFPFAYMNIGDSFLVKTKDENVSSCNSLKYLLYHQARKYCIETFSNSKYSFQINRKEQTVRVFRIK